MKRWTEMTIKITRFARESKIHNMHIKASPSTNMHIYCWYTFPFYVVGTRGKEWLNFCFTRKIYWRCRILDEPAELIPVDGQSRENSERAAGRNSRWSQAAPVQIARVLNTRCICCRVWSRRLSACKCRALILFPKTKKERWLCKFTNYYNTLISEKQDKVKEQVPWFAEAAPPVGSFLECQASQSPLPSAPSSLQHYQRNLRDRGILMQGFPRPTVAVLSPPEKDLLQLAARTAAGCICLQAAVQ